MANEFKVRKGLIVQGSGSNIFDVQGSQGQLFSITDSLSGSLFSVNDISGIPIMEVFSDNTIKLGTFNQEAIIVSGSRTGMGIARPQAELHISGANNDSLFRIQSPASASIMFVSGSGLVGIGTATPTQKISVDNGNVGFTSGFGISWDSDTEWIKRAAASDQLQLATQNTVRLNIGNTQGQLVTIGLGTTTGTAQFQVRGGGATAATTAMRIEDSGGNARLTILDDGTSAFNTNHLYVSSSGNVGIGTTSPSVRLHISGTSATNELVYLTGDASQGSAIRFNRGSSYSWRMGVVPNSNFTIEDVSYSTVRFQINNTSGLIGINTTSPNARLHISGANNEALLIASSSTAPSALYVSGSGNIGVGTTTPGVTLDVVGQIRASSTMFNSTTQTNTIQLSSSTGLRFLSASVETARYDNNGWGFFNTTPTAKVHISGANADNLFRVSSPSAPSALFVSGSGNVGIGTGTPTNTLQVVGGITATSITSSLLGTASVAVTAQTASFLPTGTYSITSSWATNALTASNITPSITNNTDNRVLTATGGGTINGESNLTFDGSVLTVTGRANISTSITSSTATVGFGLTSALNAGQTTIRGSGVDTVGALTIQNSGGTAVFTVLNGGTTGVGENNPSARLHVKGSGATSATTALRVENSSAATRLTILDDGTSAFNTSHLYVSSSGNVGIGTNLPSADLHISGASADSLLRVGSPTNPDILFVNGNGRVGINTTLSTSFLGGSNISTFTIFQNSGSGDGLTPSTGLQIINSGSSTSAQAQLSIVTVGDKFAAFNIGTSGSGTQNNYWHLSKRNSAASHALQLYNNNNGTFSSPLFSFVKGGTSTLGENSQIKIDDVNAYVGLQIDPSDWIHLSSNPGGGNYININAAQASNSPPLTAASAKTGYGITTNSYYLAEPDYWMEIKLDGVIVLIPCYLPA